ncbi:hypothetical protein CFOL_v3_21944 [Cephalotus follicularis]|uniref:Uncharacterized protein n=1 Tax=Cephalotus follicularis TaxID=3775 RepID=A0A1Q3CE38_CEPFO|nr:hypothetical protein CFOL_v3_21944 [Cephalotus follicularis]
MESNSIKVMNQDMEKLDRFDGNNLACQQGNMMFLPTALKFSYILNPNLEPIEDPNPTAEGVPPSAEDIERIIRRSKGVKKMNFSVVVIFLTPYWKSCMICLLR